MTVPPWVCEIEDLRSLGNAGADREGRRNMSNYSLKHWKPKAGVSPRNSPACCGPSLGRPSPALQLHVCNYNRLPEEEAVAADNRAVVRAGNLPNSMCLKAIFLPKPCGTHGKQLQGSSEPWAKSHLVPSTHPRVWEMTLGVQRKKNIKWERQLWSNISQPSGSHKQGWGSCGSSSLESVMQD